MCMIDDAEQSRFHASVERKARKEHHCDECGRNIERGETYKRFAGYCDGFYTSKICRHCESAASVLTVECGGWLTNGVFEDLQDHIHESLPWSMIAARRVVAMRQGWKRFDGNGLMPVPPIYVGKPSNAPPHHDQFGLEQGR